MSVSYKNIQELKESSRNFKSIFDIMMNNQDTLANLLSKGKLQNGLIVIIKTGLLKQLQSYLLFAQILKKVPT